MKLTEELKKKIDDFFDNKTPEETYDLLGKYGIISSDERHMYFFNLDKEYKHLKKEANCILNNIYIIKLKISDIIRNDIPLPLSISDLMKKLYKNRNNLKIVEQNIREIKQKIKQLNKK